MVEPVIGVQTDLERHTLGDVEILPNAHVATQEAWPTECVARLSAEARGGARYKVVSVEARGRWREAILHVTEVPMREG